MTAARWRMILNGKSAGDEALRDAVQAMRGAGQALDVRVTWETGDARRYVDEAIAEGIGTIVAAGGDGTLSEVATTLAQRDGDADALPALALVPLGTGNDFATAAGIPEEPGAALALLHDAPACPIDLLRIECGVDGVRGEPHWCANLASGGFGTQVTVETDEGLKKMLGGLAYLITGISRLGRIEPIRARIHGPEFDWTGDFIALGIGNGRQAGGGQVLCPEALLDDDLLELTIVPDLSGEVGTTVATLVAEGRQAALERVAVRARLPWLEIEAPEPFALNLDGEPLESTRFHVDCVAGRVRMHLPVDCPLLRAARREP
jgi:lipid kinase YegS